MPLTFHRRALVQGVSYQAHRQEPTEKRVKRPNRDPATNPVTGVVDEKVVDKVKDAMPNSGQRLLASHFHWPKSGEYVTQVTGIGPLGLEYLSAKDDPRDRSRY